MMPKELWLPNSAKFGVKDMVEVEKPGRKTLPTEGKKDGGSFFDDELTDASVTQADLEREGARLMQHLRERPDHTVYVGSAKSRDELRQVFNAWFRSRWITYHPNIKIDYGVVDGAIRISE